MVLDLENSDEDQLLVCNGNFSIMKFSFVKLVLQIAHSFRDTVAMSSILLRLRHGDEECHYLDSLVVCDSRGIV